MFFISSLFPGQDLPSLSQRYSSTTVHLPGPVSHALHNPSPDEHEPFQSIYSKPSHVSKSSILLQNQGHNGSSGHTRAVMFRVPDRRDRLEKVVPLQTSRLRQERVEYDRPWDAPLEGKRPRVLCYHPTASRCQVPVARIFLCDLVKIAMAPGNDEHL